MHPEGWWFVPHMWGVWVALLWLLSFGAAIAERLFAVPTDGSITTVGELKTINGTISLAPDVLLCSTFSPPAEGVTLASPLVHT